VKIAVVGGGPAGMMAAYAAATTAEVTLFEKNEKLGKKLFLTGKGRCNITNARPQEDFFSNIPGNAKFLYSALNAFSNDDLIHLLNRYGLETKVERGERVFPASDKSSDVIKTLQNMLRSKKVQIRLGCHVQEILIRENRVYGIKAEGKNILFDKVILACGGMSYPTTGSNGEGYELAKRAGHSVQALHPSLIPLVARYPEICRKLMGLSLKNVRLTLLEKGKKKFESIGEMLFTHFGISGPLVLSASAHLSDYTFVDTKVCIDLKPALDEAKLEARILRDFAEAPNQQLRSTLPRLLPKALSEEILEIAGINGKKTVNFVTKEERKELISLIKNFCIPILGTRSLDEAIVTRGGITLREINASKMQSKQLPGLYFAGEMLDVDAYTGGYNLQIAFSTGYLAGRSAAENLD
jgi:predicted Rossmann fold flavoprotein